MSNFWGAVHCAKAGAKQVMPAFAGITILRVNYEGDDKHSPPGCVTKQVMPAKAGITVLRVNYEGDSPTVTLSALVVIVCKWLKISEVGLQEQSDLRNIFGVWVSVYFDNKEVAELPESCGVENLKSFLSICLDYFVAVFWLIGHPACNT